MPADFAAQRIKNLSLFNAVVNALMPKRNQKDITSLIEEFKYPKLGPGMMWERCRDLVIERGCTVVMKQRVVGIRHENGRGARRDRAGSGRRAHRIPVRSRRLVDADLAAAAGDGSAGGRCRWSRPRAICAIATS